MLIRLEGTDILHSEDGQSIHQAFIRALMTRLELPHCFELLSRAEPDAPARPIVPSCHDITHAFGRVLGLEVIDGTRAYFSEQIWDSEKLTMDDVTKGSYMHSWIELATPAGTHFILDFFPEACDSLFPTLFLAPNAGYWVESSMQSKITLEKIRRHPFEHNVAVLEAAIKAIAIKHKWI